MNNIRIKEILIDRLEDLVVEIIDGRVEGDLNKIIWLDLEKIAFSITSIIINIGEKAAFIPYFVARNNNTVHVGIKVTVTYDSEKIIAENIELIITKFLTEISKTDRYSSELFDQHQHPFDEEIKKESINFLSKYGGKLIKNPIGINTGNSLIKMDRKFGQIANRDQLQDSPPETHIGIVDGLVKHCRTVYLKLTTTKIISAYYDHKDFPELHQLMHSEEPHQLVLQQKYDANGKKDIYLIAINKHVEKLLDFSA